MKRICIIFLLQCSTFFASSQIQWIENRDSLKNLINNTTDDTLKIVRLSNLAVLYTYNIPDSALKYAFQMLELSRILNKQEAITDAYGLLSGIYEVLGNLPQSIYYCLERKKIFEQLNDTIGMIIVTNELGDRFYAMGEYKKALAVYFQTREKIEPLPDSIYYHGGVIIKKEGIMYHNIAIADAYLAEGVNDSALYYAKIAFNTDRELKRFWSHISLTLGNVYLKFNETDSALKYYRAQIKIPAQKDQIDINIGIANVFKNKQRNDSAIYFAKIALDTSQSIRYLKGVVNASKILAELYEKTNPVEAINFYKLNAATRDDIYNHEKANEINNLFLNDERQSFALKQAQKDYKNNLKTNGLLALTGIFLFAGMLLYRNNLHRKKAYLILNNQKKETEIQKAKAEIALTELKATQSQLIQSEKMASLGELTAGIAHEIQNPLNFVNNFSEVNKELISELVDEVDKGNNEEVKLIAADIRDNSEKINHHGKRADAIVKGMLQHSRSSGGQKEPTNVNTLCDEYLRLAYHGLRAKDKSFNATMKTDFDESIGKINIIPQDIGRVFLNLINNAFYAVDEKKKQNGDGYEPTVTVSTKKINSKVEIKVADNGNGIPQKILDKIFQPFFTTKPTGQGTGLGLSLSYDIVKAHGGELKVETKEARPDDPVGRGEGSTFIIVLPSN